MAVAHCFTHTVDRREADGHWEPIRFMACDRDAVLVASWLAKADPEHVYRANHDHEGS